MIEQRDSQGSMGKSHPSRAELNPATAAKGNAQRQLLNKLPTKSAAARRMSASEWWLKTSAGALAGFSLALALVGIWAWAGPGGIDAPDKIQFVMWMITPLWMLCFSGVYLFARGLHAWCWLLMANVLAYAVLFWVKH